MKTKKQIKQRLAEIEHEINKELQLAETVKTRHANLYRPVDIAMHNICSEIVDQLETRRCVIRHLVSWIIQEEI